MAALLVGSACGGNNGGGGNGVLVVVGNVRANSTVNNAMTTGQFNTEFNVRVTRAGAPVPNATVGISSSCGVLTLTPAGDVAQTGEYRAAQNGYCRSYTLEVTAGSDRVAGATVVGPDAHRFMAPTAGQPISVSTPLRVLWTPSGADSATIETRELGATAIVDMGSYEIPGAALRQRAGRMEDERVRVTRRSQVILAGGAPGSTFGVSVTNTVEFVTLVP